MSILQRLGTRFWPARPTNTDWVFDLEEASFGPLRLGTAVDEVKRLLGRPTRPTLLSTPNLLWYANLKLMIVIGSNKAVEEVQINWDGEDSGAPDLMVRLGNEPLRPAREVTEELISSVYGAPSMVDHEKAMTVEWLRLDDCVFIDLSDDGKIVGIGFMTRENAST